MMHLEPCDIYYSTFYVSERECKMKRANIVIMRLS